MNNENWIEVSSGADEVWDGKDLIQGIYINRRENVGPNNSLMYTLKVKNGEVGVWGSTVIDSKMSSVPIGSEVIIQSLGVTKSEKTGREYKDYLIKYRPAPFQEVNSEPLPKPPTEEININDIPFN